MVSNISTRSVVSTFSRPALIASIHGATSSQPTIGTASWYSRNVRIRAKPYRRP